MLPKLNAQTLKKALGSSIFGNILAIIGIIISILTLTTASQVSQTIKSINIDGNAQTIESIDIGGDAQTAQIINNGADREEVQIIAEERFAYNMDRLYDTLDIIQKVSDNPNLHFSIIWSGTRQEMEELDKSELPPYVTYYISD